MEPSRQEDGGSFPPVEELFDHFRNEDGVDWDGRPGQTHWRPIRLSHECQLLFDGWI